MGNQGHGDLPDFGTVPVCRTCRSERVVKDAWACWNPQLGLWELETVFDHEHCLVCDGETHVVWKTVDPIPRQRIRELNDRLRTEGLGHGSFWLSLKVKERGPDFVDAVIDAIRSFTGFTVENDHWGEHEAGTVEVAGVTVCFRIDYFTPDLTAASLNPANEGETHRVLTVLLRDEC